MNEIRSTNSVLLWVLVGAVFLTAPTLAQAPKQGSPSGGRETGGQDESPQPDEPLADPLNEPDDFSDLSLEELMTIEVVTASRRAQSITTVPYAVSIITAEDIRWSGARSVPDALRLAAGVDVADLSFGNAAVSPRGFHGFIAGLVLVLVDGRQIYDSLFGGTVWGGWPFQLEDIERIEVIRGPGGVTWGANAINGVINIITKDPSDQLGLTLSTSGGSRGWFKQHFGLAQQKEKLRLRISGEYEAGDGFAEGGSMLRFLEDEYKGGRLSLHAVYDADENTTITISAGSAVVDGGYPPTPLAGIATRRNAAAQGTFVLANWERRITDDEQLGMTLFVNDSFASPGLPQIDYRYQQIGWQFSHTVGLDETKTRTWGIDTRVDLLDAGNSDPFMLHKSFVSTVIIGLYLQQEWRLTPATTLSLGGRVDYESYGGFEPSARASISHQLSDHDAVYASVSRAFALPSAAARYLYIPLLNGMAFVTTADDVDPTTLMAYEAGYRGRLFGRLDTSVNLFWHQYDETTTLSPQLGPPGLLQTQYDNRPGDVALYGAEVEASYELSEQMTLIGNYTYQQLEWDVDVPFTDRDYITPPRHKFMLGARYTASEDLRFSGHLYFVDDVKAPNPSNPFLARTIDSYVRVDVRAEYEFWNDSASLAVGVSNLLDPNHYEGGTLFLNDAEVPRMAFAELRIRIR